jgi:hypothetical protein
VLLKITLISFVCRISVLVPYRLWITAFFGL